MADEEQPEEEQGSESGFQLALLKSYLAFVQRAIRSRLPLALLLFVVGAGLTIVTWRYLPRTFVCSTVMMGESNKVFGDWQPQPFAAAGNLIRSKENLEAIARDTKLAKTFLPRRPPLLKAKDSVVQAIFGKWDDDVMQAIVVGTLESRIDVSSDGATMTVSVSWTDGATAAELAEAARESFLKMRRATETAAFTEKMAILDRHATKVRQEVEQLAEQIRGAKNEAPSKAAPAPAGSATPPQAAPRRFAAPRTVPEGPDPGQAKRKDDLQTMKRRLADLEGERERQLREERARLADLRLKLAPSHPNVLTSPQRIEMLSQVPSELALLRAEVAGLEQEIAQRDSMGKLGMDPLRRLQSAVPAGDAEPLPVAITELLNQNDVDQALLAQLSGALTQYGALRTQIRSERVDIDTADAAFNQRYRVVVPAQQPNQPVKPKPMMVLGSGLLAAVLLALLLPLLLELRTGIIVERWQVQHLQIPVLAELRLPPRSGD
jgi:uncharacterized protein involved in exopolysaccharide biosynthesis